MCPFERVMDLIAIKFLQIPIIWSLDGTDLRQEVS